jgi:hypothetical protein
LLTKSAAPKKDSETMSLQPHARSPATCEDGSVVSLCKDHGKANSLPTPQYPACDVETMARAGNSSEGSGKTAGGPYPVPSTQKVAEPATHMPEETAVNPTVDKKDGASDSAGHGKTAGAPYPVPSIEQVAEPATQMPDELASNPTADKKGGASDTAGPGKTAGAPYPVPSTEKVAGPGTQMPDEPAINPTVDKKACASYSAGLKKQRALGCC